MSIQRGAGYRDPDPMELGPVASIVTGFLCCIPGLITLLLWTNIAWIAFPSIAWIVVIAIISIGSCRDGLRRSGRII